MAFRSLDVVLVDEAGENVFVMLFLFCDVLVPCGEGEGGLCCGELVGCSGAVHSGGGGVVVDVFVWGYMREGEWEINLGKCLLAW